MWTKFWDMHSGGDLKELPYDQIFIEAPEDEAKVIFYNRFGHNPERVSCTCCGDDYSIDEDESLAQLTGHHRDCRHGAFFKDDGTEADKDAKVLDAQRLKWVVDGREIEWRYVEEGDPTRKWGTYRTLDEYVEDPTVLVIRASDIQTEERLGDVPAQGYVWTD